MRINLLLLFETIVRVNTAAQQYLKCARECMLVDAGCPIKPIVHINLKSWSHVESERRISELSVKIHLLRQSRSLMNPTNDFPGIDPIVQLQFAEGLGSNSRKRFLVVVLLAPAAINQRAKLHEGSHNVSNGLLSALKR